MFCYYPTWPTRSQDAWKSAHYGLCTAEIADDAEINRADMLFDGDLRSLKLPHYERQELIQILLRGRFP